MFYRRNADIDYRSKERRYRETGSELDFMAWAQEVFRAQGEIEYLRFFEKHGRINAQQSNRLEHLERWATLRLLAEAEDKNSAINVDFINTVMQIAENELKLSYGHERSLEFTPKGRRSRFYHTPETDHVIACHDHSESIDLMDESNYKEGVEEYAKHHPIYFNAEEWNWLNEASNIAGVAFIYEHRNCTIGPEYYGEDPDPPYDTPSLPPVGTRDPNW